MVDIVLLTKGEKAALEETSKAGRKVTIDPAVILKLVRIVEIQEEEKKTAAASATEKAVDAVLDLMYALKEIGGKPTLKDLVKLAQRIRG